MSNDPDLLTRDEECPDCEGAGLCLCCNETESCLTCLGAGEIEVQRA